ncbi:hypothetical protein [Corynebacterium kefirresidentii]|nr:hypothetical protein [Corynebacterium kefirresidentii]
MTKLQTQPAATLAQLSRSAAGLASTGEDYQPGLSAGGTGLTIS